MLFPASAATISVVPELVTRRHQLVRLHLDRLEHFRRRHPVRADIRRPAVDLLLDAGHPDLEELVQVRRKDGQELDALHQWLAPVLRLLQDAPVERQPTQFSVYKILGIRKIVPHQPRIIEIPRGAQPRQSTDIAPPFAFFAPFCKKSPLAKDKECPHHLKSFAYSRFPLCALCPLRDSAVGAPQFSRPGRSVRHPGLTSSLEASRKGRNGQRTPRKKWLPFAKSAVHRAPRLIIFTKFVPQTAPRLSYD